MGGATPIKMSAGKQNDHNSDDLSSFQLPELRKKINVNLVFSINQNKYQ
jgi:hypothetical protein